MYAKADSWTITELDSMFRPYSSSWPLLGICIDKSALAAGATMLQFNTFAFQACMVHIEEHIHSSLKR